MTAAAVSDEYHKGLSSYRSNSTDAAAMSKWFKEKLPDLLSSTVRDVQRDETLRILAIASGSGLPDAEILELLLTFIRPIQYTVVDPNESSVQIFKDTVTKAPQFRDTNFKFYTQTIQSFLDGPDCSGPYHLIHMIDALCYIDDVFELVIETCVRLLTPEGIFFTYFPGADVGMIKVYNNSQERLSGPSRQMYLVENMEKVLADRGIPFTRDAYDVYVDIGAIFSGVNEEADELLEVLTEVKDVRTKAPALIQPLLDDIKQEMITVDGKLFLKDLYCFFVMRKPKS